MSERLVTLFADFTCPHCYRTEAVLVPLVEAHGAVLRPRALELFDAPGAWEAPEADRIAGEARELGVEIRVPAFRPRTRKAHEAARFAEENGAGPAMRRALYAGYWEEGLDIGRIDVLATIAGRCGLDPVSLKIALDIDQYRDAVLADEELARRLRISRAPTLFFGTGAAARILVGPQPPAALEEALASIT